MIVCSSCGTENADTNRFCLKCGTALQPQPSPILADRPTPAVASPTLVAPVASPALVRPATPARQSISPAVIGGIAGILGGALAGIGWLLPWVVVNLGVGNLLGLGGSLGLNIGASSGLQLVMQLTIGALAAVGLSIDLGGRSSGMGSLGLGGLAIVVLVIAVALIAVLVAVPIQAIQNARTGIRLFERRATTGDSDVSNTVYDFGDIRRRSSTGFILMIVIIVLASQLPIVTLGTGVFVTAFGFVLSFLGILYARSSIRPPQ